MDAVDDLKRPVLLLKSSKGDGSSDSFVDMLSQAGFAPRTLSILSFKFVNTQELAGELQRLENFSAIVFTSTRAVQAARQALGTLQDGSWQRNVEKTTCYVVGESTGAAARALGFSPLGEEAGGASQLVLIMLRSLSKESKPILFPCSEIRKDTLPNSLKEQGIELKEIVAYETCPQEDLQALLAETLSDKPDFVVFFSPLSVQYTADCDMLDAICKTKVVAFGNATKKELVSRGFPVCGTAASPCPQGLLELLKQL